MVNTFFLFLKLPEKHTVFSVFKTCCDQKQNHRRQNHRRCSCFRSGFGLKKEGGIAAWTWFVARPSHGFTCMGFAIDTALISASPAPRTHAARAEMFAEMSSVPIQQNSHSPPKKHCFWTVFKTRQKHTVFSVFETSRTVFTI